ncbi:MAG TPA: lytic transglycosylase domain-containing protein [Burkholderiaceae bacterium]|nr:lytic transglycosylase domain-containing protein [Burkholderiaceae bacterium]
MTASALAACVLATALLPEHALANGQPSSLAERMPVFDSRALLTQAASLGEFRKTAAAEAAWDDGPGGKSLLALSADLAGYLERSHALAGAQTGTALADAARVEQARAEAARGDAARAEVARMDAARAAIRRVEQQAALREAQKAAQRDEQQRRAAARDGVRPPLRLTDEQLNIARFVAERYRVSYDHMQHFVAHAYDAAREFRLDPHLVLAVVAIESSFNPKARSKKGAQGLMQVLTRVHTEKFAPFGGPSAAFDPVANLRVGSRILKEYLVREGSVEGALKSYVGAALLKHDFGYGKKVMTERKRIAAAAEAAPFDGDVKFAAGEDRAAAAKGKGTSREAGNGYVKVAVTGFGDPDGESSAQPLPKSPIGY